MARGTYFFSWAESCPERGVSLSHAHPESCDHGHPTNMCCHCEAEQLVGPALMFGAAAMKARLESLGMTPAVPLTEAEDEPAPEEPEHDDDTPVEPKMAEGTYPPTANKYGPGRGEATPRFLQRVEAYVGWRRWLAEKGEAEVD